MKLIEYLFKWKIQDILFYKNLKINYISTGAKGHSEIIVSSSAWEADRIFNKKYAGVDSYTVQEYDKNDLFLNISCESRRF